MNPARVFALQSQRIGNPDGIPGGRSSIDQATAASLCAGMRREYYLAGRLKWAGDWSVSGELEKLLWLHAVDIRNRENWSIPKGGQILRKMAGLAIAEIAEPARYKTDSVKAQWMGIHRSNYSRTWNKRYNLIYQELDDLANRAFSYIMMKQRYADV